MRPRIAERFASPTGCIVWFSFPSSAFKLGVRHPMQQLQMWCRNTARHDAGNDVLSTKASFLGVRKKLGFENPFVALPDGCGFTWNIETEELLKDINTRVALI